MKLTTALRDMRKRRKLSQTELAKAAGLSTAYISHIENGKRSPTLESLKKISDALEIPFPFLALLALEAQDIAPARQEAFNTLMPPMTALIQEFFVEYHP